MAEDKWPTATSVLLTMLRHGWVVTSGAEKTELDGKTSYSYRLLGRRGPWTLAFEAAEGLVDEGALGRMDVGTLGKVVRTKYGSGVISMAMSDDAALMEIWKRRITND